MTRSTPGLVAVAAAVLLVLSSALLLSRAGDAPPVDVLGLRVERTTTTSTEVLHETTTTVALTIPGPVQIEPTTTSSVGGTTTSTAVRTTTTVAGPPSGRTVERADTSSSFDYRPEGGGAMAVAGTSSPRDTFKFTAVGSDVDHDGVAELRSEMANQTSRDIAFPEGLVLRFVMKRDGQAFRTVELRFPDTQSLPAGGSLEIESATPLQHYGRYEVTGEVTIEYR